MGNVLGWYQRGNGEHNEGESPTVNEAHDEAGDTSGEELYEGTKFIAHSFLKNNRIAISKLK
jgi:hypothetical protein